MVKENIIEDLKSAIKYRFEGDSTGHDWFHIERVWRNARAIALQENANLLVVELGALLHDIADHKFVVDFESESTRLVNQLLMPYDLGTETIEAVHHIVQNCSYKGGTANNAMKSLEGKIVQDADKLDAIGAIGIARAFAFGGKFGSEIYNPDIEPIDHQTLESYQKNRSHTINHFYEKLLKLKDLMHTATGQAIAEEKHRFMVLYLEQFYKEWQMTID